MAQQDGTAAARHKDNVNHRDCPEENRTHGAGVLPLSAEQVDYGAEWRRDSGKENRGVERTGSELSGREPEAGRRRTGGVFDRVEQEAQKVKFIDFFAGIGGFRRGLELSGHECVGFCEWDKFATASYTSMHLITEEQRKKLSEFTIKNRQKEILKDEYRNGEWYSNDIRTVDAGSLPDADCWCFGAPCQDFSIAGKRAGLKGDRSSLIREIFRLLEEQKEQDRPEWLIYENVKGMLSSNRGLDYLSILSEMDRLGYDIEWQNINSKWWVPQNRERIYTVGHLRRYGREKILPVTGTDGENSVCQVGNYLRTKTRENPNQGRIYDTKGISPCLNKMDGGGREPSIGIKVIGNTNPSGNGMNGNVFCEDGIAPTLSTNKGEGNKIGIKIVEKTNYSKDRHLVGINIRETEDGFHSYRNDKKKSTIQGTHVTYKNGKVHCLNTSHVPMTIEKTKVNEKQNSGIYVEMAGGFLSYCVWYKKYNCYIAIRRLTPKECFRLQGWTDDYFEKAAFVNSDSQLYKQAGNGVTVDVVKAIGEKINAGR